MSDCHRPRGGGQLRQEIPHGLVVAESAVLREQHDGHGSELLRNRGEAVIGLRCRGNAMLEIRHGVSATHDHAALADHHDARAPHPRPAGGGEERIDQPQVVSAHARSTGGRTRGAQGQCQDFAAAYHAFQISRAAPIVSCCWLRTSGMHNSSGSMLSFSSQRSSLSTAECSPNSPKRRDSRSISALMPNFWAKRRSSPTDAARSFRSTKWTLMRRSAKKRSAVRVSALLRTPKI